MVIGLHLCPFAAKVYLDNQLSFKVLPYSESALLQAINTAVAQMLDDADPISTVIIVLSEGLDRFEDYLDVYYGIEEELSRCGLDADIQLASFHPEYVFADADPDAVTNYTNRSPYPSIHILRVADVHQAISAHADVHGIPEKNKETLKNHGLAEVLRLVGQG